MNDVKREGYGGRFGDHRPAPTNGYTTANDWRTLATVHETLTLPFLLELVGV